MTTTPAAPPAVPTDPLTVVRTRGYLVILVFAAILGVPISAAAYGFLALVSHLQKWIFTDLPEGLGFSAEPTWWPVLPLFVAGVLVALTIRYLPGTAGNSPADGFKAGERPTPIELPGIVLAALATLALGVVLGPEGPLIAIGAGLAICAVRLVKPDAPPRLSAVMAAAGSFAAISALLGSPLLGAFLLLEASGLGGAMATTVLLPGLLTAGIGYLIFIGLDSLTGLGTYSLALPDLPNFARPNGVQFLWALAIGLAAAVLAAGVRGLALRLRPVVERRLVLLTPLVGLAIAGLAILYAETTDKHTSDVLFSGQDQLPGLIQNNASYTVGALLMLVACKGLAYSVALSSFRGGPVFPSMYIGAAGGILLSHLPGLSLVPAVAMGIGAMSAAMLRLPMTAVLLATLLLASDGVAVMPLVIVAVVVAFVTTARLAAKVAPAPAAASTASPAKEPSTPTQR
jgi:H+/Cl- antiporter ClcA